MISMRRLREIVRKNTHRDQRAGCICDPDDDVLPCISIEKALMVQHVKDLDARAYPMIATLLGMPEDNFRQFIEVWDDE